ncbi:hypothetical protein [Aeromonas veronii]|uniref:hypothetical protein n=1 Tax=Aeromonas veronii TaxID=654 RepID=UPI003006C009
MDALTFISELIKAAVWPVTAIVLVVLLRKPIVELTPLLRKLKYKELELELEFAQEVSELKAEVEAIAKEKGEDVRCPDKIGQSRIKQPEQFSNTSC